MGRGIGLGTGTLPAQGEQGRTKAARRPNLTVAVFLGLSLLFGTYFALVVPLGWGPDETSHFSRVYQVANGGIAPERLPDQQGLPVYGGAVPQSAVKVFGFAGPPATLAHPWDPLFNPGSGYAAAASQPLDGPLVTIMFPNTSVYSPLPYLPAAAGLGLARLFHPSVGQAWIFMRLAQVLCYAAITAVGLFALRTSRFRWVALALALLPTAIYQSGVVSADAVTNAVAFTFLALVAKAVVLRSPDPASDDGGWSLRGWEGWVLYGCAVLLPLLKPTYVLLSLLLLVVPLAQMPGARARFRPRVLRITLLLATLGVMLAGLIWWTALSAGTTAAMGWMRSGAEMYMVRPGDQVSFVLHNPLTFLGIAARTFALNDWSYLTSFFGQMGYGLGHNLDTTAFGALCTVAVLALGLIYGERGRAGRWRTTGLILVWLASFAAIFGALYLTFAPVGSYIVNGVQGRYFVPLALLLAAVAVQLVPARLSPTATGVRRIDYAVYLLCAAALLLAAGKYTLLMYTAGHPI